MNRTSASASAAFAFVLIMGGVNLFADVTYEGGGSINGQFMGSLGATAAAVSITAGAGEFLGYALRSVSGYFADRTGRYWTITFAGYAINLLAVPAMALVSSWQAAALLIILERVGRAFRKPTVEAMLSYTTGKLGRGWVYAVNNAMDETGAMIGPLAMAAILFFHGDYRIGFGALIVPAALALATLGVARIRFPTPSDLAEENTAPAGEFTRAYWISMLAGACFAAGLMSFELVSYHLSKSKAFGEEWIPVLLALSTACGIGASLVFGKLFDRHEMPVVTTAVMLSSLFSPLVFFGGFWLVLIGMLLWGVGYATQDSLLKALIARLLPEGRRSLAFGLFYAGYGAGWLVGSLIAAFLYERSLIALVAFAIVIQLAAIPIFWSAQRSMRPRSD